MIGECMYQMGDLAGALEQYSAALQVYLSYQDWLLRLERTRTRSTPSTVRSAIRRRGARRRAPFGGAGPGAIWAVVQGNTDEQNMQALQQGGVISHAVNAC